MDLASVLGCAGRVLGMGYKWARAAKVVVAIIVMSGLDNSSTGRRVMQTDKK